MLLQATRTRTTHSTTRLWLLMGADLVTVVWMHTFGTWLDQTSRLTSTATLGGHHVVVLVLAAIGFAMLTTLAILTDGFTTSDPRLKLATNIACVVSVIALAGLLAFILAMLLSRIVFGRFRP